MFGANKRRETITIMINDTAAGAFFPNSTLDPDGPLVHMTTQGAWKLTILLNITTVADGYPFPITMGWPPVINLLFGFWLSSGFDLLSPGPIHARLQANLIVNTSRNTSTSMTTVTPKHAAAIVMSFFIPPSEIQRFS